MQLPSADDPKRPVGPHRGLSGLRRVLARHRARGRPLARTAVVAGIAVGVGLAAWWTTSLEAQKFTHPSRSTTIALTKDDSRVLAVNRETHSLSIIRVRGAKGATITDTATKIAEVVVGQEPRCVALHPKETQAFVTNTVSGTVSVVDLTGPNAFRVTSEIPVGTEPRGCALSPTGNLLFVANHTQGSVSVIDTRTRTVVNTVNVGGKPTAIAVTNDGDLDDNDETVFVTQFLAELNPTGLAFSDTGRRGVVHAFNVGTPTTITKITLAPVSNAGFNASRVNFCPLTRPAAVSATTPPPANIFCPDFTIIDPTNPTIAANPQGAFPNQLQTALIRNNRLYLPSIGAAPSPPVRFNVNVQGLVHVVDTSATPPADLTNLTVNLNQQIATETPPTPAAGSLVRAFVGDLVAMDANLAGTTFLIVSRGGNYVLRAGLDANGKLTTNGSASTPAIRFQTGNLPNGVVISRDDKRAYVNNEVNVSVTAINLENNTVITRDIPSGDPPLPGTFSHGVLVGKLAFFTALGVPDNGILSTPIRNIVPVNFRNKASDNAWSSCGSCHPDGLADGVTWIFADGPRQTLPLDGFNAKDNPNDQRINNWSAVRDSPTDFNNNARGVQNGCGFASAPPGAPDPPVPCVFPTNAAGAAQAGATPANPNIYDHGITQGASDALDAITLWIQTVRAPILPQPSNATALADGRTVFETNCATCHGGPKWTKSQVLYQHNPAFADNNPDPAVVNRVPLDPGITATGNEIQSYTAGGATPIFFLENVGTFTPTDPQEVRAGGQLARGALGFNPPSLLGVGYHAPYLHDGSAETLEQVFQRHRLAVNSIATALTAQQQADLLVFLRAIDGRTAPLRSDADRFRDEVAQ